MMGTMSFSSAPDLRTLGRVSGALAVDEAFVEKDWFVIAAIQTLGTLGGELFTPVFSGGTSLLKGHKLIKRFSEDIDFKLMLSDGFGGMSQGQKKKALSNFKKDVAAAWATMGFSNLTVEAGSGNEFIKIEMDYPTVLAGHASLRPHIQAELSAKPPRRPPIERSLTSFVGQFRGAEPEVPAILCVDPVETAADKLSAFAWRALVRDRDSDKDDATIIRHIHDLAALEAAVAADTHFPGLLHATLVGDTHRGKGAVAHLSPAQRMDAMLTQLDADPLYETDYRRFVEGMAFAEGGAVPDFAVAVTAVRRLASLVER